MYDVYYIDSEKFKVLTVELHYEPPILYISNHI